MGAEIKWEQGNEQLVNLDNVYCDTSLIKLPKIKFVNRIPRKLKKKIKNKFNESYHLEILSKKDYGSVLSLYKLGTAPIKWYYKD